MMRDVKLKCRLEFEYLREKITKLENDVYDLKMEKLKADRRIPGGPSP